MAVEAAARQRLQERETERFAQRHPRSLAWLGDSASVLPDGVPMSWMRELYGHPPPVVAHAEGVTFPPRDAEKVGRLGHPRSPERPQERAGGVDGVVGVVVRAQAFRQLVALGA